MGSRSSMPRAVAVFLAFFLAGALFAADWTDAELAAPGAGEKLAIAAAAEKTAAEALALLEKHSPRLPAGAGRRRAYSALAELRELMGDYALAAEAWDSAASSEPGPRHEPSILESARCLIAVGELEKASVAVGTVLLTGKDASALSRARVLSAFIAAFRNDGTALPLLKAVSEAEEYAADRPTILFLLVRVFGDKAARERLLGEYPASPEALVLAGKAARIASLPLWLLPADRESLTVRTDSKPADAAAAAPPTNEVPEQQSAAAGGGAVLQVGLFKAEKNAQVLVSRLASKGFKASSSTRTVGGVSYWVVTVVPQRSVQESMMQLKDAGFESFPLF